MIVTDKKPIIQVSLDVTTIEEAMELSHAAVKAGVDWLEADSVLGPWQWVGALLLVGAILWISTRGVEANAHSEESGVRT